MKNKTLNVVVPARNIQNNINNCLSSILKQKIPDYIDLNITVVDDASDLALTSPFTYKNKNIRIVRNDHRLGRAATRNAGVHGQSSDYITFVDGDCYLSDEALISHIKVLESGADLAVSPVQPKGDSFWALYQKQSDQVRQENFKRDGGWALTSAFFSIKHYAFHKIQGFDERYFQYGFEDRDFFLRAAKSNFRIEMTSETPVLHDAELTTSQVAKKMFAAGAYTSEIFDSTHPVEYRRMTFSRIDVCHNAFLRLFFRVSYLIPLEVVSFLCEKIVRLPCLPYRIKRFAVLIMSAYAYYSGTARRYERNKRHG